MGGINPSIPLQIDTGGRRPLTDITGTVGRAVALRDVMSRTKSRNIANEEAERQQHLAEQRRKAFVVTPEGQVDEEATRRNLAALGDFEAISAIDAAKEKSKTAALEQRKSMATLSKTEAEAAAKEIENATARSQRLAELAGNIQDQASYDLAKNTMLNEALISEQQFNEMDAEFNDDVATQAEAFRTQALSTLEQLKEARENLKVENTEKNQRLVRKERERHNRAMEQIADRRGDQTDARLKETTRHNKRMEKLGAIREERLSTGGGAEDATARRQRQADTRRQIDDLDKEEQRLDRQQTVIGQQLATPDGEEFVSIDAKGNATTLEMTAELRTALENRMKANEQEVLAVARRKAQKVYGNDLQTISANDLRAYADARGISIAEAERRALADGFALK